MAETARTFVGLYFGPSGDGVDAAAAEVRGSGGKMEVRQVHFLHRPADEVTRKRLRAAATGWAEPAGELAKLDRDLGRELAGAGESLLAEGGIQAARVAAVGVMGATAGYIRPAEAEGPGTILELGFPAVVAERIRRPVVAGFVRSDLAAGGVGGPVWAWPDWRIFRDERLSRVVVQIGSIASMVFVGSAAAACEVVAFDTGPGTVLIDAIAAELFDRPFDADGAMGARGKVHEALLNELLAGEYFQRKWPKATHCGEWAGAAVQRLEMMAGKHRCPAGDLLTTVTELTARSIARSILAMTERPHEVLLAGGGAMNIHLAGRIRALLSPSSTRSIERYGVGLRAHAAVCCAVLAAARVDGFPAHCPTATGAKRPAVLGAVWEA